MATRTEEPLTVRRPSRSGGGARAGARRRTDRGPTGAARVLDVSVLVPAKDEAANLPPCMEQMATAFSGTDITFEVIVIDDGSVDGTWAVLGQLEARYPFLVRVRHRRQPRHRRRAPHRVSPRRAGDVLVFYPGRSAVQAGGSSRASCRPSWPASRTWSRAASRGSTRRRSCRACTTGSVGRCSSVPVRDLNSVKAYRREIMEVLPIRPDWHRYMIVIAAAEGYRGVRDPGAALSRERGPVQVRSLAHLRRGARPAVGVVRAAVRAQAAAAVRLPGRARCSCIGFLTGIVALLMRFVIPPYEGFRPLLNLIETCLILGFLSFATGLLGEQIAGQRAELRSCGDGWTSRRRTISGVSAPRARQRRRRAPIPREPDPVSPDELRQFLRQRSCRRRCGCGRPRSSQRPDGRAGAARSASLSAASVNTVSPRARWPARPCRARGRTIRASSSGHRACRCARRRHPRWSRRNTRHSGRTRGRSPRRCRRDRRSLSARGNAGADRMTLAGVPTARLSRRDGAASRASSRRSRFLRRSSRPA